MGADELFRPLLLKHPQRRAVLTAPIEKFDELEELLDELEELPDEPEELDELPDELEELPDALETGAPDELEELPDALELKAPDGLPAPTTFRVATTMPPSCWLNGRFG